LKSNVDILGACYSPYYEELYSEISLKAMKVTLSGKASSSTFLDSAIFG
jgi:hypothetical protein